MSDVVFIQRSQFGRSIFSLRGDTLDVTSHLFGRKGAASFPLRSISPDYVLGAQRLWVLIAVPLVFAVGCILLVRLTIHYEVVGPSIAINALIFGTGCVFAIIRGARRVEYFVFHDPWKRPLFSIIREREQSEECNAFVRELLDRIERAANDVPSAEADARPTKPGSAVRLPAPDGHTDAPRAEHQWKLAIVAGVVSALFPVATLLLIPEYAPLDPVVVVIAGACSGLAAALSFSAKEKKRYWAIAGVALAIVPLVFY